jgi:hypothetical protein
MRAVPPYRYGNGCELPPLGWCGFYCKLPMVASKQLRLNWCGNGCKLLLLGWFGDEAG